jgi:hypothetical protein
VRAFVCVCGRWQRTHLEVLLQLARLQRRLCHRVVGRRELGRLVDVHQQHRLRDGGLGVQPRASVAMPARQKAGEGSVSVTPSAGPTHAPTCAPSDSPSPAPSMMPSQVLSAPPSVGPSREQLLLPRPPAYGEEIERMKGMAAVSRSCAICASPRGEPAPMARQLPPTDPVKTLPSGRQCRVWSGCRWGCVSACQGDDMHGWIPGVPPDGGAAVR